jgi:hypothetical protein
MKARWVWTAFALLPALLLAWLANGMREERRRVAEVWRRKVIVPLSPQGSVELPADPKGGVLHAVLIGRDEEEILPDPDLSKAFRWRIRGKDPHPPYLGTVVEASHQGRPVVLEYDVTPVTMPWIERGALSVRPYPVLYKREVVGQAVSELEEKVLWVLSALWFGAWGVGLLLSLRRRSDPQAAP